MPIYIVKFVVFLTHLYPRQNPDTQMPHVIRCYGLRYEPYEPPTSAALPTSVRLFALDTDPQLPALRSLLSSMSITTENQSDVSVLDVVVLMPPQLSPDAVHLLLRVSALAEEGVRLLLISVPYLTIPAKSVGRSLSIERSDWRVRAHVVFPPICFYCSFGM